MSHPHDPRTRSGTQRPTPRRVLAGIALTGLLAAGGVQAGPVFPPPHLTAGASFASGTASARADTDAWYHEGGQARRRALADNEVRETSPHPTAYYFVRIRAYANDESARLEAFRARQPRSVTEAGREDRPGDGRS